MKSFRLLIGNWEIAFVYWYRPRFVMRGTQKIKFRQPESIIYDSNYKIWLEFFYWTFTVRNWEKTLIEHGYKPKNFYEVRLL